MYSNILFGGIGLVGLSLSIFAIRADYREARKYVVELMKNPIITNFIKYKPFPIYRFSKCVSYAEDLENYTTPTEPLSMCKRIQVNYLYDPSLSRFFRLLGIIALQYHTIYINALLYSGNTWSDIIAVAFQTGALNIPMFMILLQMWNVIGIQEYEYQFPYITQEYRRRVKFEKIGIEYLKNKKLIRRLGDIIKTPFVMNLIYENYWAYMPYYTIYGAAYILFCAAWITSCVFSVRLFESVTATASTDIILYFASFLTTSLFINIVGLIRFKTQNRTTLTQEFGHAIFVETPALVWGYLAPDPLHVPVPFLSAVHGNTGEVKDLYEKLIEIKMKLDSEIL